MIIFLDIDGVLHPDPATAEQAFCRRLLLIDLLSARPELQVVISSDWRLRISLPELTDLILSGEAASLKQRFIGVTPALPGARYEYEGRQQECLQWLRDHAAANHSWLAVDDVAGHFTYGSPHLVLTDHRTGLIAKDIDAVLSRLSASAKTRRQKSWD